MKKEGEVAGSEDEQEGMQEQEKEVVQVWKVE